MKKKVIVVVIVIILLILLVPIPMYLKDGGTVEYKALTYKISKVHRLANALVYEEGIIIEILGMEIYNNVKNATTGNESEMDNDMEDITNMSVLIDGKKYNARIEDNKTAQTFVSSLPQEFNMKELNGNEKYIYMDNSLPTNSSNPKHIKAGDIMLYGNDCLVIFYKSFDTNYSYTRIGHIDNLPDLGSDSIIAKFEK